MREPIPPANNVLKGENDARDTVNSVYVCGLERLLVEQNDYTPKMGPAMHGAHYESSLSFRYTLRAKTDQRWEKDTYKTGEQIYSKVSQLSSLGDGIILPS